METFHTVTRAPSKQTGPTRTKRTIIAGHLVEFPDLECTVSQDAEWCWVHGEEGGRRLRFHDYHELYTVPGLYEHVFYERLGCNSPRTVCELLQKAMEEEGRFEDLRVLDVGAGNGMVGEELENRGVQTIVGVDIVEEAAEATERDRPGTYDDYLVVDLTDMPKRVRRRLEDWAFNCLVTVAALGFGDIPPQAFAEAYNLVAARGWVAFNIKEDFLAGRDSTGFSGLVRRMIHANLMEVCEQKRYRHRFSTAGDPLHYVALVARKNGDIPEEFVHTS